MKKENNSKKNEISPRLGMLKKSTPEPAPEGYFESLEHRVWSTVRDMEMKPNATPIRSINLSNILAIAATLCILICSVVWWTSQTIESTQPTREENLFAMFIESEDFYDVDDFTIYQLTYEDDESYEEIEYLLDENLNDLDEILHDLY